MNEHPAENDAPEAMDVTCPDCGAPPGVECRNLRVKYADYRLHRPHRGRRLAAQESVIPPAVSSCMDCGHVGSTNDGDCAKCGGPACPIPPARGQS